MIRDLYDNSIVAYKTGTQQTVNLVLDTIRLAMKREKGENPFVTAPRELNEEVGAAAARWTELGSIIVSPGCYAEVLYL